MLWARPFATDKVLLRWQSSPVATVPRPSQQHWLLCPWWSQAWASPPAPPRSPWAQAGQPPRSMSRGTHELQPLSGWTVSSDPRILLCHQGSGLRLMGPTTPSLWLWECPLACLPSVREQ